MGVSKNNSDSLLGEINMPTAVAGQAYLRVRAKGLKSVQRLAFGFVLKLFMHERFSQSDLLKSSC
jgi:hypothetical protein